MAATDSSPDTDGAPAAAPVDDTPQAGNDGAPDGAGDDTTGSVSAEDARKLRSEAKALRQRLRTAEEELQKRQDSDLSDKQRLERDASAASAAKSQLETENRSLRAQIAASKAGVKPDMVDLIPGALDWEAIEQSDDPGALDKAIKGLLKDRPSLGSTVDLDGGAGRGTNSRADGSLTDLLLAKTGRN